MIMDIGKGIQIEVDLAKFPANVREHYFEVAIWNALKDSHASVTKEKYGDNYVTDSKAVAEK